MASRSARQRTGQQRRPSRHVGSSSSEFAQVEFIACAAAILIGALAMWRSGVDGFALPRVALFVPIAIVLLAHWAFDGIGGRADRLRSGPVMAAGAVLVAMVIATLIAPNGWWALLGPPSRWSGLVLYMACGTLFVAATLLDSRSWRRLLFVAVAATGLVSAYGALQWLGADPFSWPTATTSTIFGTFGQTNFAAGWISIMAPLCVFLCLDSSLPRPARWASASAGALAIVFAWGTKSFQVLPATFIGLLPITILALRPWWRDTSMRRRRLLPACVVALSVVVVFLALPGTRDRLDRAIDTSGHERVMLWGAAGAMFSDAPIAGKGLGSYGLHFYEFKPSQHAREYGALTADAPHSVPLQLAAEGGLLLAGTYLAFVALVGVRLFRGLRRESSLLLAAVGGAWLAYQTQALVSFDVPWLASLHWLLAGGVLALTSVDAGPVRRIAPRSLWGVVAGVGALVVVSPFLSRPVRADLLERQGLDQLGRNEIVEGVRSIERAADLAPWSARTWANLASAYQFVGRGEDAIAAGEEAVRRNQGSTSYRLALARLAGAQGDHNTAIEIFDAVTKQQPENANAWSTAAIWGAAAGEDGKATEWYLGLLEHWGGTPSNVRFAVTYLASNGGAEQALPVVQSYLRVQPELVELHAALADVYAGLARWDDAIESFQRVLELSPGDAEATARIAALELLRRADAPFE